MEIWAGFSVSSDKVTIVIGRVQAGEPVEVISDQTFNLQKGERAQACAVLSRHISDHLKANGVAKAFVKASAAPMKGAKLAMLHSAEIRGVVMAAAGSVADTKCVVKASVSKTFGERKFDEYLKDESFWANAASGKLRSGSREAALLIITANG